MFESQIHLQCSMSDGVRQECPVWVWDMFGKDAQSMQQVVVELMWYLDIFYTDVSGWVKLADIYAELNLCMQVFSACVVLMLGQVHTLAAGPRTRAALLLLTVQNLFQLHFAETAYTAEDMPLALKT